MNQNNKLAFEVEYLPGITLFNVERAYIAWSADDILTLYRLDATTNQYSQMVFSAHISQLTGFRVEPAAVTCLSLFVGDKKYRIKSFDGGNITANSLDMVGLGDIARSAVSTTDVGLENLTILTGMLAQTGVKNKTINTTKITIITVVVTVVIIIVIAIAVALLSGE